MMKIWKKRTQDELKEIIFSALEDNVSYFDKAILGVPASYLNEKVFHQDASFLKDAPFLSAFLHNPNHIGCHTLGKSESFFQGTHEIEKELLDVCAVDILKGEIGAYDGYVAAGGTEANIQAMWVYRNYFQQEFNAGLDEIAIICSSDSHYSMEKASNLLSIDLYRIQVEAESRKLTDKGVLDALLKGKKEGKKYFIVLVNMMTTMFGSIDDIDLVSECLDKVEVNYKIHVDGAYGGFYYPFSNEHSKLTFQNPSISSFTLDAHKMAQSPYGTGIFLIRKGLIHYANTKEAKYVEGEDYTLSGSRSGANAISVWMILSKNGPYGWYEKIYILQKRTSWLCEQLEVLKVQFYRSPFSNIVTIKASFLPAELARKYYLVPDNHSDPKWYKIVLMEHVTIELLQNFIHELKLSL